MENRVIENSLYVSFSTTEECGAWVTENGWQTAEQFEIATGYKISELVRRKRWVRAYRDSFGRSCLQVHLPRAIRVPTG
jgi:hypothetical protein